MRAFTLISLAVVVACGPSKTPAPAPEPAVPSADGVPPNIDPRVSDAVPQTPRPLPVAPDVVWRALPAAYDSLGIRLNVVDPSQHLMGNQGMKVRQRLGTTRLSKYLDCGETQIGPNADSYEVLLSVVTHVGVSADGVTNVSIRVAGAARPMAFSQDYQRCTSTGEIERRLFELVKAGIERGRS